MAKKKAASAAVWIILLLVILGLSGYGISNFGGSVQNVGKVGDTEISVTQYARAVQNEMQRFSQMTGQRVTFQQAQQMGIDASALGQLVSQAALEDETAALGLSVGNDKVAEAIRGISAFQGIGGKFERDTYARALKANGLTIPEFEKDVRARQSTQILTDAITRGVTAPPGFAKILYVYARESRSVTWAHLTAKDLTTPVPAPTDAQIEDYYKAHPDAFTLPETRVVDYAWATPDMMASQIKVSEADIQALYDQRKAQYQQPEKRVVDRLGFTSEAAAKEAKAKIDAGTTTFDALVKDRGLALTDVEMGDVTEADLGEAGKAVFALPAPGVVGPLPSSVGPALFQVSGIIPAKTTPLSEVHDKLAQELAVQQAGRSITDLTPKIQDLLAGGADIKTVADKTGLTAGSIDWRKGMTGGIADYPAFQSAAEAAKVGDFPKLIDLKDGGLAVISLKEIRKPELQPLADVRQQVIDAWTKDETGKALTAEAEALAKKIEGGAEMAGLGLTLKTSRNVERTGTVDGTPTDFLSTVFDMKPDEVKVISSDGEAWLVRLDTVTKPDPNAADAQAVIKQYSDSMSQDLASSMLTSFTRAVLGGLKVNIDQSAINAVNARIN